MDEQLVPERKVLGEGTEVVGAGPPPTGGTGATKRQVPSGRPGRRVDATRAPSARRPKDDARAAKLREKEAALARVTVDRQWITIPLDTHALGEVLERDKLVGRVVRVYQGGRAAAGWRPYPPLTAESRALLDSWYEVSGTHVPEQPAKVLTVTGVERKTVASVTGKTLLVPFDNPAIDPSERSRFGDWPSILKAAGEGKHVRYEGPLSGAVMRWLVSHPSVGAEFITVGGPRERVDFRMDPLRVSTGARVRGAVEVSGWFAHNYGAGTYERPAMLVFLADAPPGYPHPHVVWDDGEETQRRVVAASMKSGQIAYCLWTPEDTLSPVLSAATSARLATFEQMFVAQAGSIALAAGALARQRFFFARGNGDWVKNCVAVADPPSLPSELTPHLLLGTPVRTVILGPLGVPLPSLSCALGEIEDAASGSWWDDAELWKSKLLCALQPEHSRACTRALRGWRVEHGPSPIAAVRKQILADLELEESAVFSLALDGVSAVPKSLRAGRGLVTANPYCASGSLVWSITTVRWRTVLDEVCRWDPALLERFAVAWVWAQASTPAFVQMTADSALSTLKGITCDVPVKLTLVHRDTADKPDVPAIVEMVKTQPVRARFTFHTANIAEISAMDLLTLREAGVTVMR